MYKDKLYDFLVKKENFEVACEIEQHLPEIKKQLLSEFWNIVVEKLKSKCKKTNWIVEFEESDGFLGLYLKEWLDKDDSCFFWIGFGDIYTALWYGFYLDEVSKKYDWTKIDDYSHNMPLLKGFDEDDNYFWKNTMYDFTQIHTLINILPSNRELLSKNLVETLFKFAESIKEDVNIMNKMTKK